MTTQAERKKFVERVQQGLRHNRRDRGYLAVVNIGPYDHNPHDMVLPDAEFPEVFKAVYDAVEYIEHGRYTRGLPPGTKFKVLQVTGDTIADTYLLEAPVVWRSWKRVPVESDQPRRRVKRTSRDAQRHQHPKALLRIGVRAADKVMRGKRPSERVFKQAEQAAFKAIMVADPQAGTSTHRYRVARYSHGVSKLAHRATILARRLNWTPGGRAPEWSKRV